MATVTADQIVDAARSLLGTPYVLHGRVPGIGIDCAGVFVCAAAMHGITITLPLDYARSNSDKYLRRHLGAAMDEVLDNFDVVPGVVLVARFGRAIRHLSLMETADQCIEAVNDPGVMKVVRRPIEWWRIERAYAIRGVLYPWQR